MQVVRLHRKVHDSKPRTRRSSKRPPNFEEGDLVPQARQTPGCSQRDVDGIRLLVLGASDVGNRAPKVRRLSAGATAPAASRTKAELPLLPLFHVNRRLIHNYRMFYWQW